MRRPPNWILGTVSVLIVLAALELISRAGLVSPSDIPPPSDVLAELWRQLGSREFWSAVGDTLSGWGIGLAISIAGGVLIGVTLGLSDTA